MLKQNEHIDYDTMLNEIVNNTRKITEIIFN